MLNECNFCNKVFDYKKYQETSLQRWDGGMAIVKKEDNFYLFTNVDDPYHSGIFLESPINYCPICGRYLHE